MVILASAICTKTGKALASRQFVEMPRTRIEGLLASFPKLMVPGQQHTTVETETIRYVYQPIGEDMYVVLITSRQNNIVQDMDTLHLIARAVSDICDVGDQQDVVLHGFELLQTFEEIISQGYRDNVDLAKLRTIMEMESQEEKIQEIIEKNKEREAKQEMKRQANFFDQQRREAAKRGVSDFGASSGGSILGGGRMGASYEPLSREPEPIRSFGSPSPSASSNPSFTSNARGMRLGRKPKGADILGAMRDEVGLAQAFEDNLTINEQAPLLNTGAGVALAPVASSSAAAAIRPPVDMKDVHIQIEEHITAIVNRDGGLEQMEVKGDLSLIVSDEAYSNVHVGIRTNDSHNAQVKTHPKIDKKKYQTSSVISLKDPSGSFPVSQPIGVLKWRIVSGNEDDIPLTINCWPSPTGSGTVDVNIEYELNNASLELEEVVVSIPLPSGVQPTVSDVDGVYNYDRAHSTLEWQIPTIDSSNKNGSLDFSVSGNDAGVFFPVHVSFVCKKPYYGIVVTGITTQDKQEVDFSETILLVPEQYAVI
ncbi:coatomer subunit delta [Coemansia spiralis]|uniref:Coatomer subunit delta n=2 Tax=Coemansia TaxID=4863 RepID=A0A9W8G353_9FUNG|nr:Mu homology domain-containing protein [Coemansia spiralis]KAJ1988597.1 coatomer subunit delta [Coemansia umbellata]KAJ2623411.1 coatomer subunit delta [Coemansia sp. RSA 1358]KAJ2670384.1 coatomer subunit delta [Coemansia spiralis]